MEKMLLIKKENRYSELVRTFVQRIYIYGPEILFWVSEVQNVL